MGWQGRRGRGIAPEPYLESADAAGWRATMEDRDSLVVSAVGLPRGLPWKVEMQDERWEAPFETICHDPTIALQLPRGSKYAPAPVKPQHLKMRMCLMDASWSAWTTLAEAGSTDFIPLGYEELRPGFERFKGGRLEYHDLHLTLRAVGLDPTSKISADIVTGYNKEGTMTAGEFAELVGRLRRAQMEAFDSVIAAARAEVARMERELAEARDRLGLAELAKKVAPDVRACFERYDRNNSGRLDYKELRGALGEIVGVDPSMEETQRVIARFDTDRSGLMEIDEFAQLVDELRKSGYEIKEGELARLKARLVELEKALGIAPDVRAAFARYDKNSSGKLDHKELRAALGEIVGVDPSMREAQSVLARFDRDRSGLMEIDEFAKLVEELRKSGYEIKEGELARLRAQLEAAERALGIGADVRAAFRRYDKNNSGKLDHKELRAALGEITGVDVGSQQAQQMIAKYDRDRSGLMEIDEFAALVAELRKMGYDLKESELARLRAELEAAKRALGIAPDVRAAFERYDRNKSGKLDHKELRAALGEIVGVDPTLEQSQSTLARYDRDKSGLMEIDEFAVLVEELRKMGYQIKEADLAALRAKLAEMEKALGIAPDVRAAFERYDRNKSGKLDHKELRAALGEIMGVDPSAQEAQNALGRYDRDRSGLMEIDEFAALVAELRKMGYDLKESELARLRAELEAAKRALGIAPDVRAAFERYDRNKSGKLDHKELRAALGEIRGVDPTLEEAQRTIAKYDRDKSGLMEIDEFARLVEELRRMGFEIKEGHVGRLQKEVETLRALLDKAERSKRVAPEIRAVFERFDRDNSGRLDYSELRAALQAFGLNPSVREAEEQLARYDRDKSGQMEIDEFAELVGALLKMGYDLKEGELSSLRARLEFAERQKGVAPDVRAIFESFDTNGNGKLDYAEVRAALQKLGLNPSADEANRVLAKYDKDRSGAMELEEFGALVAELRRIGYDLKELELAALREQLKAGGGRQLAALRFSLRGVGLAAMDRHLTSANSSDPYYVLHSRDASGRLTRLGKSNTVSNSLNPTWDVVEVKADVLGGAKHLHVEVWDHDAVTKDDFIGVAEIALPDLDAAFYAGQHEIQLQNVVLANPKAKPGTAKALNRGTLEGSYALVEGSKDREVARLRAELEAMQKRRAGGEELAGLRFSLRGVGLAAMDRKLMSSNSSDPYYKILGHDASGKLVQLAKSNTVSSNLNPTWNVVELGAHQLHHARALRLEVYDHDAVTRDDLIGAVDLPLPADLDLIAAGEHQLPRIELADPKAKGDAPPKRGAIEGSYVATTTQGGARLKAENEMLRATLTRRAGGGERELDHISFSLRGVSLAAMDRKMIGTNSSDPYFVLKGHDPNGKLVTFAKSNTVSKNLNPNWDVVQVSAEQLGANKSLTIEVYDHDAVTKDDLIGVADVTLPADLLLLAGGQQPIAPLVLVNPKASSRSSASLQRGTLEGSFTVVEKSHERDAAKLKAELDTLKARMRRGGAGGREVVSLKFSMRGEGLPAMDRKVIGTNSSDPYFVLKGHDAGGHLVQLAKSNTVKKNLNPQWDVLEVAAGLIGSNKQLHLEVYDHDAVTKDDLIGFVEVALPDLDLLGASQHHFEPLVLMDPRGKADRSGKARDRGTVHGTLAVVETGEFNQRETARVKQENEMLRAQLKKRTGDSGGIASLNFSLRGVSLAALDRKVMGANSSDPYFVLKGHDASGKFVQLGKSNTVSKNLNPTWDVVEIGAQQLAGSDKQLHLEVYDHDAVTKDDLIGEAEVELPDFELLGPGQHELKPMVLADPKAKEGKSPRARGTVEGSLTVVGAGAHREREATHLKAENERLRAQLKRKVGEGGGVASLGFALRGEALAALDRKVMGANSSDPYFILKGHDAGGHLVQLGKSNTINKNLNPTWDVVHVSAEQLHGSHLTVEVYDHDAVSKDDLIGAAQLTLPELELLGPGEHPLQAMVLANPKAQPGTAAALNRGTLHGTLTAVAQGGFGAQGSGETARLRKELDNLKKQMRHPRGAGAQRQLAGISFSLRGVSLAAMDKKMFGASSSDPYFILKGHDASGKFVQLGKSNTVSKNLNPFWDVVEVSAEQLGGVQHLQQLSVEVYDHDAVTKDDLIGAAEMTLPDLDLLAPGQHSLEPVALANPKAKPGTSAALNRGTLEGSFTLVEKGEHRDRENAQLSAELAAKERELQALRAQLGLPPQAPSRPPATPPAAPPRAPSAISSPDAGPAHAHVAQPSPARPSPGQPARARGGPQLASLDFSLHAEGLAAMDRKLFGKASSDPYFTLQGRDASGTLYEMARSNTVKKNLNPTWDVVQVSAETLGVTQQLRIEVRDHDKLSKDDVIGMAEVQMPPLDALLARGAHTTELSPIVLTDPNAKPSASMKVRGTIKGSMTVRLA